jgi:type I restriction enzyme R subunit
LRYCDAPQQILITDINSEDRLVQKTFAEHLQTVLGWDSAYAWNEETFGPDGHSGSGAYARTVRRA